MNERDRRQYSMERALCVDLVCGDLKMRRTAHPVECEHLRSQHEQTPVAVRRLHSRTHPSDQRERSVTSVVHRVHIF